MGLVDNQPHELGSTFRMAGQRSLIARWNSASVSGRSKLPHATSKGQRSQLPPKKTEHHPVFFLRRRGAPQSWGYTSPVSPDSTKCPGKSTPGRRTGEHLPAKNAHIKEPFSRGQTGEPAKDHEVRELAMLITKAPI